MVHVGARNGSLYEEMEMFVEIIVQGYAEGLVVPLGVSQQRLAEHNFLAIGKIKQEAGNFLGMACRKLKSPAEYDRAGWVMDR
jgi:hypothetical protein